MKFPAIFITLFSVALQFLVAEPQTSVIKVSVVNGLAKHGPWPGLSAAWTEKSKVTVETSAGQREQVMRDLQEGKTDVALVHNSESLNELVKTGVASELIPWAASGFVITGPKEDPAGLRGLTSGAEALKRIISKKAAFVAPDGQGTRSTYERLLALAKLTPEEAGTFLEPGEEAYDTAVLKKLTPSLPVIAIFSRVRRKREWKYSSRTIPKCRMCLWP